MKARLLSELAPERQSLQPKKVAEKPVKSVRGGFVNHVPRRLLQIQDELIKFCKLEQGKESAVIKKDSSQNGSSSNFTGNINEMLFSTQGTQRTEISTTMLS